MNFALCNEVIRDLPFQEQCALAAKLGYTGLEVAPFTLGEDAHLMGTDERRSLRQMAEDHGLSIIGLHWLLVAPQGLSITTSDQALAGRTLDVIKRLIELCVDLGGSVMVHGSPAQRDPADAPNPKIARDNALACLRAAGNAAAAAGITYCLEPLATNETPFINTVEEAVDFIREAQSPGLRTMIDTSAAAQMEPLSVAATIEEKWGSGHLAHIQLNDRNQRAPGQGNDRFYPVLKALKSVGYTGPVSVEPFVYEPDGPTTAAAAIGYLQGLAEALAIVDETDE